jgi:hypothetical protein
MRVFLEVDCPSCIPGDFTDLLLSNSTDDLAGVNVCCGRLTVAACPHDGDIDADGTLTEGDAICAFQIYLNGQTVPPECDVSGVCEVVAADVNCDSMVTPEDASAIYNAALEGEAPYPCFAQGAPSDAAGEAFPLLPEGMIGAGGILAVHPNPTRGRVAITFAMKQEGEARLRIIDVSGREAKRLALGIRPRGIHRADWNGLDERGGTASAGFYWAILEANGDMSARKVVLLR